MSATDQEQRVAVPRPSARAVGGISLGLLLGALGGWLAGLLRPPRQVAP